MPTEASTGLLAPLRLTRRLSSSNNGMPSAMCCWRILRRGELRQSLQPTEHHLSQAVYVYRRPCHDGIRPRPQHSMRAILQLRNSCWGTFWLRYAIRCFTRISGAVRREWQRRTFCATTRETPLCMIFDMSLLKISSCATEVGHSPKCFGSG